MLNIFEHFLQGRISDFEKCERRKEEKIFLRSHCPRSSEQKRSGSRHISDRQGCQGEGHR